MMVDPHDSEPPARPPDAFFARPRPADRWDATSLVRVLDAAANRATEGLRVAEDYARFVLDDRLLTECGKQIRHDLTESLRVLPTSARHAARETRTDVGTGIALPAERRRADTWAVCAASLKRAEQALRSLEEFVKIADAACGARIEALRYRVYTWEQSLDLTRIGAERLRDVRLYVLVDGADSPQRFERLIGSLIDAGVDALQLRDKRLSDRLLLARARQLRDQTRSTGTLMIINDRPDLARLSNADGVHVGQDDLMVREVRRVVGPRMLVGVSTHSIEQVSEAVAAGANMIGVGPTFASTTKAFHTLPGLDLLTEVSQSTRLPAFAIGGIDVEHIDQVKRAGLRRVAVGAAVTASGDPPAAVRALRKRLEQP